MKLQLGAVGGGGGLILKGAVFRELLVLQIKRWGVQTKPTSIGGVWTL